MITRFFSKKNILSDKISTLPPFFIGNINLMADAEQLEAFIREHYVTIYTTALKFVGSRDCAQDIAQDIIVKFWENREKYQNLDSIKNFLFIITRNEALNYLRGLQRENLRHEQLYSETEQQYDLLDKIIEEESNQILLDAIGQLPPQSNRIIRLSLTGKNMKEIAETLNVSVNTVRTLYYGAIRKLREYFIENKHKL